MIHINRQTDYAIRVILALAKQGDEAMLPTSKIQQEMLIPEALSLKLAAELADSGLKFAWPAAEINLCQVVTNFEKNFTVSEYMHDQGSCSFDNSALCAIAGHGYRL